MELHVFSDRHLTSVTEWQRAIDAERFPLRLSEEVDLTTARGFLPAMLNDQRTGFECYHDDAKEAMSFLGAEHFNHAWPYAFGFRWGGDFNQLEAAWMAATSYAAVTGGIIFDHEEGRVLTLQQARVLVTEIVRDRPLMEARMEKIVQELAKSRPQ